MLDCFAMRLKELQNNLRKALWERIEEKKLTGLKLAQQTGFKQAHISNFLNAKRNLSFESIDQVLRAQHLSVLDLLDPNEVAKRATIVIPSEDEFETVLVVDGKTAASRQLLRGMDVKDFMKFKKSFLQRLRPDLEGAGRAKWERFAVVKVESDGGSMAPKLAVGGHVLIDRHYNSLKPYRKGESNIYAARVKGGCTLRYADAAGRTLVLRPHNPAYGVDVIHIENGKSAGDYIVGRVSWMGMEV